MSKHHAKLSDKAKHNAAKINPAALDVYDANALGYVEAVLNPFLASDVRFPDGGMHPTACSVCYTKVTLTPITAADASVLFGIVVKPCPRYAYAQMSAATTSSTGYTWGATQSMPQYATLSSSAVFYRTLALGMRFLNYGAGLKRGGFGYAGHWLAADGAGTPPTGSSFLSSTREVTTLDMASAGRDKGEDIIWFPMNTSRASGFYSPTVGYRSALQWTGTAGVVGEIGADPSLILVIVNTDPTNVSNQIMVELIHHIEWIPVQSTNEGLFEMKLTPGDPSRVADALQPAQMAYDQKGSDSFVKPHGSKDGMDWGKLGKSAIGLAGEAVDALGGPAQLAKHAIKLGQKFLPGKLGKLIGGLGRFLAKKHMAAMSVGIPELSPYYNKTLEEVKAMVHDEKDDWEEFLIALSLAMRRRAEDSLVVIPTSATARR